VIIIYVVIHSWEDNESCGDSEIAYFTERYLAEEFRDKFIKHWQERNSNDYNCPNKKNTTIEECKLYGKDESPELLEKRTTIKDLFCEVLRDNYKKAQDLIKKENIQSEKVAEVVLIDDGWKVPF
jgi:hypothetical protein